jgi:hypothetical protein
MKHLRITVSISSNCLAPITWSEGLRSSKRTLQEVFVPLAYRSFSLLCSPTLCSHPHGPNLLGSTEYRDLPSPLHISRLHHAHKVLEHPTSLSDTYTECLPSFSEKLCFYSLQHVAPILDMIPQQVSVSPYQAKASHFLSLLLPN